MARRQRRFVNSKISKFEDIAWYITETWRFEIETKALFEHSLRTIVQTITQRKWNNFEEKMIEIWFIAKSNSGIPRNEFLGFRNFTSLTYGVCRWRKRQPLMSHWRKAPSRCTQEPRTPADIAHTHHQSIQTTAGHCQHSWLFFQFNLLQEQSTKTRDKCCDHDSANRVVWKYSFTTVISSTKKPDPEQETDKISISSMTFNILLGPVKQPK